MDSVRVPTITMKRRVIVLLFIGFFLIQGHNAFTQIRKSVGSVEFPASPEGRLGQLLIEAVNSGDQRAMSSFIGAHITEWELKQTPPDEYLRLLQKMYTQSGGVDVVEVSPPGRSGELRLIVRSKRGDRWARLYMMANREQPDKLDGFGVIPVADPEEEKALPWPQGKVSEAEAVRHIEMHAAREASQDRFSGVVLVSKGDRVIFHKAYGQAEKSFNVPNRLDTKFNLGSMGKMFTSVAIAQLVEQGRLSFKDTLAKVLPEYPNKSAAEKITIEHLLTHTAGLGGFFDRKAYDRRRKYQNHADYFQVFAGEPLIFEPGQKHRYSNEGFIVLGAVIEKLAGKSYYEYVREHIFTPAGMKETGFYALDEVTPNLAVGYMLDDNDPFGLEPRRPNFMFLGWRGNACGGGYSTAVDMLKFSQALRSNKLLSAKMTETVASQQGTMPDYGYGFQTKTVAGKSVRGHSGGGAYSGINSDLEFFQDGSYAVAVMGNYDAPAAQKLARQVIEFLARQ